MSERPKSPLVKTSKSKALMIALLSTLVVMVITTAVYFGVILYAGSKVGVNSILTVPH